MSRSSGSLSRKFGSLLVGLGLIFALASIIPEVKAQVPGTCNVSGPPPCPTNCARCSKGTTCYLTAQYCDNTAPAKSCGQPITKTCVALTATTCGNLRLCWNKVLITNLDGSLIPCTDKIQNCSSY